MPPFQSACAYADVPAGGVLAVNVEGLEVAIVRADDGVYAIKDECSR
jgi:3-phenylpropionate/trans-cinnamate dioxygenase ferredoxin subunit